MVTKDVELTSKVSQEKFAKFIELFRCTDKISVPIDPLEMTGFNLGTTSKIIPTFTESYRNLHFKKT